MQISVISDHQSTVIVHPPKATFNDPTPAVSLSHTDGTATTAFAAFSLNGGNGGLDSSSAQPDSERTAVISFVSHQFLGPRSGTSPPLRYPNRFQGGFRQPDFMMLGTVQIQTERHSLSITTIMTLVPLPTLVFLISSPLFWREQIDHQEKLEPIRFSLPHPFGSTEHAKPAPTSRLPNHCFNRRHQVVGEPYFRGMSAQAQPVFNT